MHSLEAKRRQLRKKIWWLKSTWDLVLFTDTKKITIGPFLGVIIIYFRKKTEVNFVQFAVNEIDHTLPIAGIVMKTHMDMYIYY